MKKLYPPSKVYVAKSSVKNAGFSKRVIERGVFAAQNIKKSELIEKCPIIKISKNDTANLKESILTTYFFYFDKGAEFLVVALGFGSLYNHSYEPNAIYRINQKEQTISFTALKKIKKNEEITFNYSFGNPKDKAPLWFEV